MDAWNNNRARVRRPKQIILQDQTDKDRTNHNKNQLTHDPKYPHRTILEMMHEKAMNSCQAKTLSKLIDRFAKIHKEKQVNKRKMERKDTEPKVMNPPENLGHNIY